MNLYKSIVLNEFEMNEEERKIVSDLNSKLKNISTFEELKELEKEMEDAGWALQFRTKRAQWHVYGFTPVEPDKIHYLLGDGISMRTQKIKDLWKYIEVGNTWR